MIRYQPREKRARLAERLIASLDEEDDIEEAWRDEVRQRLDAYRDGDLDTVPADDVLDEARHHADP